MIESYLVQDEGEKLVIQGEKELSNVKCQSTCGEVFNLPWLNNVSKCNPTSVVDLCLRPLSWLGWIKLLEIIWNWRHSPIIFSKSFPIVLRRTIWQYDLGESKVALLGLWITTIVEVLKWDSQCPKSIQALAISMNLQIQSLFLMIDLT